MFKSKQSKLDPNATDTLIGEGSHFEGKVKSDASIRVEGHMKGDIECVGDVTIGDHGMAESNITARNVTIAGHVSGHVHAKGKLSITSTGKLFGNMFAGSLSIEEGGVFQGNSQMEDTASQTTTINKESSDPSTAKSASNTKSAASYEEPSPPIKTW